MSACAARPAATPATSTVAAPATSTTTTASAKKAPIDPAAVETIVGAKPAVLGDVVKVAFPRNDVAVEVDGVRALPPFLGLTSWAGLDSGLEVTALHNHFFFDEPHVYFMHIGGEGTTAELAKGVRAVLDAERAVRKKSPQPQSSFGAPPLATPSHIDGAKLDAVFGVKGEAKDGMYEATMGRKTRAACGCEAGGKMGVNTWAAFAGTDAAALVDGDFAVLESELQPVLKSLLGAGLHVVAIHSHMTGEEPRILFLHDWGRAPALDLAKAVKKAVDLTAWDGRTQST